MEHEAKVNAAIIAVVKSLFFAKHARFHIRLTLPGTEKHIASPALRDTSLCHIVMLVFIPIPRQVRAVFIPLEMRQHLVLHIPQVRIIRKTIVDVFFDLFHHDGAHATAFGLNVLAGDQYIALVLPSRVFRAEFARRGLAPYNLSRLAADSATVTSPLIAWNSCGAYMGAVLGVSAFKYLPFAIFNIASPVLSVLYGMTGFKIEKTGKPSTARPGDDAQQPAAEQPEKRDE